MNDLLLIALIEELDGYGIVVTDTDLLLQRLAELRRDNFYPMEFVSERKGE